MTLNSPVRQTHTSRRRILIVDDDASIRQLLARLTESFADALVVETGEEALEVAPLWQPDIVLLDIRMPGINGYETCRGLKRILEPNGVQVIMISGCSSRSELADAFKAGADDYLVKPLNAIELRSRIDLHIRLVDARDTLSAAEFKVNQNHAELRAELARRDEQIAELQNIAVYTLAKIADSRDNQTGEHLLRLREYAQCLAEYLSGDSVYSDQIDDLFLADLHRSTPLHDIGKVGIPDSILLKPGPLDESEYNVMKRHTTIGGNLIKETIERFEDCHFLEMAADIAMYHHERWDGKGYPEGLKGDEIPLAARIVSIADVFDALTNSRPYKDAWTFEQAYNEIVDGRGTQFEPALVDAFIELREDFEALAVRNANHFVDLIDQPMPDLARYVN